MHTHDQHIFLPSLILKWEFDLCVPLTIGINRRVTSCNALRHINHGFTKNVDNL
jgi:hypothetical protein